MQLLTYMTERKLTFRDMADLTGQDHEVTVWRHAHGHRMPSHELIEKYEKATGRAVQYKDWMDQRRSRAKGRPVDQGAAGDRAAKGAALEGAPV